MLQYYICLGIVLTVILVLGLGLGFGIILSRRVYVRSRNKMAVLRYAYTLGKQTSRSPERRTSRKATSAEFLEVQIPPRVLVYDWDP